MGTAERIFNFYKKKMENMYSGDYFDQLVTDYEKAQKRIKELEDEIDELNYDNGFLNMWIKELEAKNSALCKEIAALDAENDKLNNKLAKKYM